MTTTYMYGSQVIHDGVHYFLTAKNLDFPEYKQTAFQIARLEGVKKTGERIDQRTIQATIKVLGTSRADLEARLDTLFQGLSARQQNLTLHAEDARYFIADAISGKAQFSAGRILAVDVPVSFVCQQPFAYAASPTSSSASGTAAAVTGTPNTWRLVVNPTGAGNIYARPLVSVGNTTAANATTLTGGGLTSGTPYTSIAIAALPFAATAGQTFVLYDSPGQFQRVVLSANAALGATSLSVVSFTANGTYPAGDFCGLDVYLQSVTIAADPNGTVLTVPSLATFAAGLPSLGPGGALVAQCDPLQANGLTAMLLGTNTPLGFTGAFPALEPGANAFTITVVCTNQPSLSFTVSWTPRWLS